MIEKLLEVLAQSGPIGAVLAWALWQHGKLWPAFVDVIRQNAEANQKLADSFNHLKQSIEGGKNEQSTK